MNSTTWSSTVNSILAPETATCVGIKSGSSMAEKAFFIRRIALSVGLGLTALGFGLLSIGAAASLAGGAGAPIAISGLFVTLIGGAITGAAAAGYDLSRRHAQGLLHTAAEDIKADFHEGVEQITNSSTDACKWLTGYSWKELKTPFGNNHKT